MPGGAGTLQGLQQNTGGQDRTGQPFPSFLPYISNIPSASSAAFGTRQVCSTDQGHLLVTNGVNSLPKEEIPRFSFLLHLPLPTILGNVFGEDVLERVSFDGVGRHGKYTKLVGFNCKCKRCIIVSKNHLAGPASIDSIRCACDKGCFVAQ